VLAYVGRIYNLKDLKKDLGLCCGSRLRKGEVFAYVGSIQTLKDLEDQKPEGPQKGDPQRARRVLATSNLRDGYGLAPLRVV